MDGAHSIDYGVSVDPAGTRVLRDIKIHSVGLVMHPLPHMELHFTDRSPLGTFERCPQCEGEMRPEHAHFRCVDCGWRDSCCD